MSRGALIEALIALRDRMESRHDRDLLAEAINCIGREGRSDPRPRPEGVSISDPPSRRVQIREVEGP
jgi:hypothetical protein